MWNRCYLRDNNRSAYIAQKSGGVIFPIFLFFLFLQCVCKNAKQQRITPVRLLSVDCTPPTLENCAKCFTNKYITMAILQKIVLCSDFSKTRAFATLFFGKNTNNVLQRVALSNNSLYSFGVNIELFGFSEDFFAKSESDKITQIEGVLCPDGKKEMQINLYDVSVLEVTDGTYKGIEFTDGQVMETFHRAFLGTREECVSDLKRQYEKHKSEWKTIQA